MKTIQDATTQLLELLGHDEEPFGVYYSDTQPADGFSAKEGGEIFTREREAAGQIDWSKMATHFTCIVGSIWLARKKKAPAWVSLERCGCPGGAVYSGVTKPYLEFIPPYVSTGIPGTPMHGEHYLPSPEAMRAFLDDVDPRKVPKPYVIIKPLSLFAPGEKAEVVVFFARGEVLGGLMQLACYGLGSHDAVASPFGAGCTNIIAWPQTYKARGLERAVLGGMDPSARKFLKADEMTFSMPLSVYEKMLGAMETSFLTGDTWAGVRKKVAKSRRAWGEE